MYKKPIIAAIAAMAKNRVIGCDNKLPWHIPADFQHLKAVTAGKPLVMGRKTYESLGRPLPGRPHVIITNDTRYRVPSNHLSKSAPVAVTHTLNDGINLAMDWAMGHNVDEIMIFGGAQIYAAAMPRIKRLYLTLVDLEPEGDAFFPEFDMGEWTETARKEIPGNPSCTILTLERDLYPR